MSDSSEGSGAFNVEVSEEFALRAASIAAMLSDPALSCPAPSSSLADVLTSVAPFCVLAPSAGGLSSSARGVIALRPFIEGEVLLEETALCWTLSRYSTLEDPHANILASLPPPHALRLLRDTLCFHPDTTPADGFSLLSELTALGLIARDFAAGAGRECAQPQLLPAVSAGGGGGGGGDDAVPRRAQLLHAIFQCNAHSATLPPDGQWLRGLLWPLLARISSAEDRDRLFDDEAPFSAVAAVFPGGACFNHSCVPNCIVRAEWIEGQGAPQLAVRAARDIAVGEELTYSYAAKSAGGVRQRRRDLLLTYRFRCCCELCRSEEPRAGLAGDPLEGSFPWGAGLDARADVQRGGAQWAAAAV